MGGAPYFNSGGYVREQGNAVGVFLVDVDGNPYTASGGTGGGGGLSQMQLREGAAWVNVPGTAARGLLVDPSNAATDGQIGLAPRTGVVAGYDGTNVRTVKTSSAGVVQVDVLTMPASGGGLTDAQLRASPVPMDSELTTADLDTGAGTDTRAVIGLVKAESGGAQLVGSASPLPVSGPLTDTQLRASAVPVSGTVTATGPLTDTQLRASAVPVSGTFFQATQPVSIASTVAVDSELTTADLDTGAGTDNRAVVGLVRAESGGGALVGSANPLPVTSTQLPAALVSGRLSVDGSGVTQPVSGTVTADTEMSAAATLADNMSNPSAGGVAAFNMVWDGSTWDRMTASAGGAAGTEYTEGDVDATITGGAVMWEDTSDTLRAVSAAKPFPVNVVAGGTSGVQYTEADVDSTITGTAVMWEDTSDTLRAVSTAKPLPVAQQGTVNVNPAAGTMPIDDAGGTISVDDGGGSVTIDNNGTFAVQDSQKIIDNNAFSDGTTRVQPMGYVFDEVAGTALTENDMAAARIDSKRSVVGVIEDATTRGQRAAVSAGGALKVDGSAVTQPVSGTVTANAGTGPFPVSDNAGSLTVDAPVGTPVFARLSDGTAALVGQKTMANSLPVAIASDQSTLAVSLAANQSVNVAQVAGTATAVNTGTASAGTQRVVLATDQPQLTNALKVDGSAVTQPVSGTVTASNATGNVAHDGVDSGNPVKVGGRALSADITAVAAQDRSDFITSLLGKNIVLPYALPAASAGGTANSTGTGDTQVIAAPGAGIRLYITTLIIVNASTSVATKVQLKSAANALPVRVYADANGGGAVVHFPTPLRLNANEALNFANITGGADVDVSAVGFTAAE